MLPSVQLRRVSRQDVRRISQWLGDDEVASNWFGRYASGEPVHRGYEPHLMSTAPDSDWDRVFVDDAGHIGECQALFDDRGGTELSLLIGRRSLWRQGYGTASLGRLLRLLFQDPELRQVWASVPVNNHAALRLLTKLGFAASDEPVGDSQHMTLDAPEPSASAAHRSDRTASGPFDLPHHPLPGRNRIRPRPEARTGTPATSPIASHSSHEDASLALPVVTVTGMPGSGSERVAAEVARALGVELADDTITRDLCRKLKRTVGEFRALEASYRSIWSRILRALAAPWERYGVYDTGGDWLGAFPPPHYVDPTGYLTKQEYTDGLRSVIGAISSRDGVVIHGRASRVLLPKSRAALHVFTSVALATRVGAARREHQIGTKSARALLRQTDREFIAVHQGLFDMDPTDPTQYDISLNMDRLSEVEAARVVAGAVRAMAEAQSATPSTTVTLESAAN